MGWKDKLLPCPFCGGEPTKKYIGNAHTKKRTIIIKCTESECRATKTDATLRHNFEWLEKVATDNWNQRPHHP